MKFIDTAEIRVKAGDGGAGMSHFRREKYVPAGGPDGGDGGKGGDVILRATNGLSTLLDFRYQRFHEAESGGKGGTNNRQGKTGENLVLKVPCGTVVYESESGECLGEVLYDEQEHIIAKGGKGGVGNTHFTTSRNQAPTKTIPPELGEIKSLRFELKMIADVAIIGSPNAGKSTLITVVSSARPKVAEYPFTTLVPTLGVVSHKEANPFVVADVPGLIPGASQGKGLGHDFLRHIERTRIIVHMIDGSQESAEAMISDFDGILEELRLYDKTLLERPRLTLISKVDSLVEGLELDSEALKGFRHYLKLRKTPFFEISSAHRVGISEVLDELVQVLSKL